MKKSIFDRWDKLGENKAIQCDTVILSYDELYAEVENFIQYFKSINIKPYQHVAIKLDNPVLYVKVFLALWKMETTIIPVDSQINSENSMELLMVLDVQHYITEKIEFDITKFSAMNQQQGLLQQIIQYSDTERKVIPLETKKQTTLWEAELNLSAEQGFLILFTSGTSGKGKGKGVLIRKEAFLNNVYKVIDYTELTKEDSILLTLPLSYCFALSQLLAHLIVGAKCILYHKVKVNMRILEEIKKQRVTNFSSTPYTFETMVKEITNDKFNILSNNLRFIMSAGGYLNPNVVERIVTLFPFTVLFNNYGQTEASPRLTYNKITSLQSNLSSVGKPLRGIDIKIMDDNDKEVKVKQVGEIVYRSEDAMLGYYRHHLIDKNAYLRSGDLGYKDEDGSITIIGRKDSMIKINGRKVYKNTIESELNELPYIKLIKLKKEKHDKFGEYFIAYAILNEGYEKQDIPEMLLDYCKQHFNKFSVPQKIIICDEFKLTSSQKVILNGELKK